MIRNWVRTALLFLIIAGFLGSLLRLSFFYPIEGSNYKYFLHAHSHVVLLGWVFNALFAGLVMAFIAPQSRILKKHSFLFWVLQTAVLGMLFAFPVQGYATWSIIFSTLHIMLSFLFVYFFLRDARVNELNKTLHRFSFGFAKLSLLFLVFSSAGPFALGALVSAGLSESNWYDLAIYFYLHFQYNGWISFALFGLFFWLLENKNIPFNQRYASYFLGLMAIACLPAYALSALWTKPPLLVYFTGGVAAFLQLSALFYLSRMLLEIRTPLKKVFSPPVQGLMLLAYSALTSKILLQCISAFPSMANLAYEVRNYTIGYLHLVFLGFVTLFLIGWFLQVKLIRIAHPLANAGIVMFFVGFVSSELYLVIPPLLKIQIPFYYRSLFFLSLLMPIGIIPLLFTFNKHVE